MISILVLALGCGSPSGSDAGAVDAGGGQDSGPTNLCEAELDGGMSARGLLRGCSQGLIGSGFAIRHTAAEPFSRFGAFLRPEEADGCEAETRLSRATLITELPAHLEEGRALATYHVLGDYVPPPMGEAWTGARVVRGSVSIDVDAASATTVTVPVLFDLGLAQLDAAPEILVVLDGFDVDTDVPQATGYPADHRPGDGYPLLSLGAAVGSPTRMGVDLRFEATATLAFGRDGSAAVDRAALMARSRMTVHYAVVGLSDPAPTGTVAYTTRCRPEASMTGLNVEGPVDARAVPAFTSFTFEVEPGSERGTRVQELSLLVDGFAHDPASGAAAMEVVGFLGGPDEAELEVSFAADVALIGWSGAETVQALRFSSTIASGHAETGLPLSP